MTEKRGERRCRVEQDIVQLRATLRREQYVLAEQNELLAQLVLHLDTVQVGIDLQSLEHIFAEQDAVMLRHVEQLNSENIGGAFQFLPRHAERRRLFLLGPPIHDRRQRLQFLKRTVAQNAEQIYIRETRVKISRDRRPKEKDGFEVRSAGFACSFHKLVDLVVRNHVSPRSLPTAAGAAATRTATTEAAKASTTTSAATESSEAASSTTKTAPASAEDIGKQDPEKDAAKRREKNDEYNDYDYDNAA